MQLGYMVMEETKQEMSGSNNDISDDSKFVFEVHNDPVMKDAIDVLEKLGSQSKIILKAKGKSIPNAVAIANIITEKMMKGNSMIQDITLDSEMKKEMGSMISTIEIILVKKSNR